MAYNRQEVDTMQPLHRQPEVEIEEVKLKKSVGLVSGIALIVGTMIGSGIFISPKGVLEGTGSVAMSLIIWAACGVLSTFGALSYAELGTAVPKSGGEHAYLMHTFGPMGKFLGPIPAFLFDWVGLFIIRPTMFGVMSLSLGTYAVKPFFTGCDPPELAIKLVTIVVMLLIAAINIFSVKVATFIQNFFTLAKLIAIAIISFGGIYKIASGSDDYIKEGFQDTRKDPSLIAIAFYNGLWAFDGWNNLNFVTEELKNPNRNLPLSIIIGIPLTTACYILANIGYFAIMSKEEILASHAVAVVWGDRLLGPMAWIMPVFVIMSCFGASSSCLFSTGRLCYVAAREGHFPQGFSYIHSTRLTPQPSIMFSVIIGIILILFGEIGTLIDFYSFCAWIVYGSAALSVIVLRKTQPDLERPYKVPIFIPIIVLLMSIYLVLSPIIQAPRVEFLYAFIFLISGLLFYVPFVYYKLFPPHMDSVTKYFQILFGVVPGTGEAKEK